MDTAIRMGRPKYTDEQYQRVRAGLLDYQKRYGATAQALADEIASATGYQLTLDGARKRVDRFLKNSHRATDDFVAAVETFLLGVLPIDFEEAAKALALFTLLTHRTEVEPRKLSGLFHGRMRGLLTSQDTPELKGGEYRSWHTCASSLPATPLIVTMQPIVKSQALLVEAATGQSDWGAPPPDMTPDKAQRFPDRGVAMNFGLRGLVMITRTFTEVQYFHLDIVEERPLTLHGYARADGLYPPDSPRAHIPFNPDYEVELVRISRVPVN